MIVSIIKFKYNDITYATVSKDMFGACLLANRICKPNKRKNEEFITQCENNSEIVLYFLSKVDVVVKE